MQRPEKKVCDDEGRDGDKAEEARRWERKRKGDQKTEEDGRRRRRGGQRGRRGRRRGQRVRHEEGGKGVEGVGDEAVDEDGQGGRKRTEKDKDHEAMDEGNKGEGDGGNADAEGGNDDHEGGNENDEDGEAETSGRR